MVIVQAPSSPPVADQLLARFQEWKNNQASDDLLLSAEELAVVGSALSNNDLQQLSSDVIPFIERSLSFITTRSPAAILSDLQARLKNMIRPQRRNSASAFTDKRSLDDISHETKGRDETMWSAPPPIASRATIETRVSECLSEQTMAAAMCNASRAQSDQSQLATDVSVFAPPEIAGASSGLVQVMLHTPEQVQAAQTRASEIDSSAGLRGSTALSVEIRPGSHVSVIMSDDRLEFDPPKQSLVWRGSLASVQFVVTAPVNARGICFPKVQIAIGPAIVGELRFKIGIAESATVGFAQSELRSAKVKRYQRVFFSYSSKDRLKVMEVAQSYRIAGVEFFQDILSLEAGARWEKGLYREIDNCDLFVLFWSEAARRSEWVEKEVRYAIGRQRHGKRPEIVPLILEGPPSPEPPPHLSHLHFDDWMRYAIASLGPNTPAGVTPPAGTLGSTTGLRVVPELRRVWFASLMTLLIFGLGLLGAYLFVNS